MGIGDYWRKYSEILYDVYPPEEARALIMLLLCDKLGVSKSHILTNHPYPFTEDVIAQLEKDITRLHNFEPIQYVLGHTWFHDLKIEIRPGALIPRPETEELISIIKNEIKSADTILDLCSGSGCIALALKKEFPMADVIGAELSDEALAISEKNSKGLALDVRWQKANILTPPWNLPQADLIVSNPPYVLEKEKKEMEPNVLKYEPHLALFVADDDPAIFYRVIMREALQILRPGGWLYFETGPELTETIKGAMRWMGYVNTEIIIDFRGKPRFVRGLKNR
jgi:release factor glutamine methyltransferase